MPADNGFRIVRMFHPTQHTPSLESSGQFFRKFFGRISKEAETVLKDIVPPDSGYPIDYCSFTLIRDVLFDSVVPERYVLGGKQIYPSVSAPVLRTTGWYVEGLGELFARLRGEGLTLLNATGEPMDAFEAKSAVEGGKPMFFTDPAETGIRYQFYEEGPFFFDPRSQPGWVLPPFEESCPFGLEFCAWHTVLTRSPGCALELFLDILGGTNIDQGRNKALGATSTFVALADAVFEFAIPDAGSPAATALKAHAPLDTYYSLIWKVGDLDRVERHLLSIGVRFQRYDDGMIFVDPRDGFGIPWGFTTALRIGDPRG